MKYYQYKLCYDDDKMIGTFWVDENMDIDENNLPSNRELAALLKALITKEVFAEATGAITEEEEE